jgi:hypothetical protein
MTPKKPSAILWNAVRNLSGRNSRKPGETEGAGIYPLIPFERFPKEEGTDHQMSEPLGTEQSKAAGN